MMVVLVNLFRVENEHLLQVGIRPALNVLQIVPIFLCCIKIYPFCSLVLHILLILLALWLRQSTSVTVTCMFFFLVSCKRFPHGDEMVPSILANSKGLKDFNRLKLDTTLNLYHNFPLIPAILRCYVHRYESLHRQCLISCLFLIMLPA